MARAGERKFKQSTRLPRGVRRAGSVGFDRLPVCASVAGRADSWRVCAVLDRAATVANYTQTRAKLIEQPCMRYYCPRLGWKTHIPFATTPRSSRPYEH